MHVITIIIFTAIKKHIAHNGMRGIFMLYPLDTLSPSDACCMTSIYLMMTLPYADTTMHAMTVRPYTITISAMISIIHINIPMSLLLPLLVSLELPIIEVLHLIARPAYDLRDPGTLLDQDRV